MLVLSHLTAWNAYGFQGNFFYISWNLKNNGQLDLFQDWSLSLWSLPKSQFYLFSGQYKEESGYKRIFG